MYQNNIPYTRSYNNVINQQNIYDQIDNEINNLQQMRERMKNSQMQQPQPTNLTQNFQLAPTGTNTMRYANTIEDVNKEIIFGDTPFFSKDMSVLWIKNIKGNIKTYELNEIIPKDEKDIQIEYLQAQIEELKGKMKDDANVTNANAKQNATNTSTDDDTDGTTIEKERSTSVQKVSRSKEK